MLKHTSSCSKIIGIATAQEMSAKWNEVLPSGRSGGLRLSKARLFSSQLTEIQNEGAKWREPLI